MTDETREPDARGPEDLPDAEVEGWIRDAAGEPPRARPAYAAGARRAFCAGELAGRDAGDPSLSGRDARSAAAMIEDRLRAAAAPPAARPAFRDELRARFVRGELVERAPEAPRLRPVARARRSTALRLVVGTLAAAAALWGIARILTPAEPSWRGFRAQGTGPVVVDGAEMVPNDLSELGGAFRTARTIETRDRRLELVSPDELALAILPGSRLEVRSDGSDGEVRLALAKGEVYLKTREGYHGPAVVVETADMHMRMTGTVVGVMKVPELSCICIARGSVEVVPRDDKTKVCVSDTSNVVDDHGKLHSCSSEEVMASDPAHITGLLDFAKASY